MMALLILSFIVCAAALVWITIASRRERPAASVGSAGDKDKILEMLTMVDDQAALSAYKKAYGVSDRDIALKRKERAARSDHGQQDDEKAAV